MLSLCDFDCDPAQSVADGPVGPSVMRGPVDLYEMESPCDSDSPGLAGRYVADNLDGGSDAVEWDSGYQHEIIDGVTVYYGGDLCDSDESDWQDPDDVTRREYVEQYNFDLLEGMEPLVFVPGGTPSRTDRRDLHGVYLYDGDDNCIYDDESIVDINILREGLGPFPSDPAVLPPTGVRWDELDLEEDWRDTEPPEHHINVCEFAHAPTSVFNADKDGYDTSLSSHVDIPVLDIPLNDVLENEHN